MRRQQPRLQRLLQALITCWALLLVFEPPAAASASWELRAARAWILPGGARPAVPLSAQASSRAGLSSPGQVAEPRAASGRGASGARASRASRNAAAARRVAAQAVAAHPVFAQPVAPGVDEALPSRLDGRYLYLEYQSLLC